MKFVYEMVADMSAYLEAYLVFLEDRLLHEFKYRSAKQKLEAEKERW